MSWKVKNQLCRVKLSLSRRHLLAGVSALGAFVISGDGGRAQNKGGSTMPKEPNHGRVEPLFRSVEDASEVISKHGLGASNDPLASRLRDVLMSRLIPQMWLAPNEGTGETLGKTRLGGAPDLPKGTAWPIRPAYPDRSKAAASERNSSGWITRQLAEAVPFEFIGQIDLAEANLFPKHNQGMPSIGRLHFFLDVAILMHDAEGGTSACKVIHDTSPVDSLERLSNPAKFDEMEASWRAPDPNQIKYFREMLRNLEAAGQKIAANAMRKAIRESEKPDPKLKKPFVYPASAKRIESLLVLPGRMTLEYIFDSDLKAVTSVDPGEQQYELLTSNDTGPFDAGGGGKYKGQSWELLAARRQRFMGPPEPEQDDPRFNAVAKSDLPPYPWNDEQTRDAAFKAAEWQMLLQVSMAGLSQKPTEGTVYFLINKEDLFKQDFSRVVAVYQQT